MIDPLVSVVVVSYNSSSTIIETLDSISAQTYTNIELIIADDASTDNTVEICKTWLTKHINRFVDARVITTSNNTGVSANANRGYNNAHGVWIKVIAADDALNDDCVKEFVDYCSNNTNAKVIVSNCDRYLELFEEPCKMEAQKQPLAVTLSQNNPSLLHDLLCYGHNFMVAPTMFIKKEVFDSLGGYDEDFPMCEDYPFWLKLTGAGIPVYYIDKVLVKYRITKRSLSNCVINKVFDDRDIDTRLKIYNKYIKGTTKRSISFHALSDLYIKKLFMCLNLNRDSFICRCLYGAVRLPISIRERIVFHKYL